MNYSEMDKIMLSLAKERKETFLAKIVTREANEVTLKYFSSKKSFDDEVALLNKSYVEYECNILKNRK